jgi:hypothetical protein
MPIASVAYGPEPTYSGTKKVTLLSGVLSDQAVLTPSGAVSGLPVINLQDREPANKWKVEASYAYIDIVFPFPVPVNTIALVGGLLSSMGILRVSSSLTALGLVNSRIFDTGWRSAWWLGGKPAVSRWGQYLNWLQFENNTESPYWRLEISDPGQTSLQFGRLMAGVRWQPSNNFDLGGNILGFAPTDIQIHTPYGRTFTNQRSLTPPRIFELTASSLNRRQAFDGIYEMQRLAGMHGDVVCVIDPSATTDFHRLSMQGHFTAGGAYSAPPVIDKDGFRYGAAIKLREFL